MLKLTNIALRRGARQILRDVSVTVYPGQRLGVTGANGSGKSSLFALICGDLEADAGELTLADRTVIAQVRQETPDSDQAAIDYVMDGDAPLREIERQLELATASDDYENLARLHDALDSVDGFSARARAGKLMHGLGFTRSEQDQAVNAFSGGWRMRLNLARALMTRSELLLLDEPTNHLDMDAMVWLEAWLLRYQGMLLIITHDREFLDRVATHIAHIADQRVNNYSGNYSEAEKRRAEQLEQQHRLRAKQQREIAHITKFVERFRYKASKARQAQSRLKALEKMESVAAVHASAPFTFTFPAVKELPDPMMSLDRVDVGYGQQVILKDIQFSLAAGARIGLLGANGAGKSTMMKLLAGVLTPWSGECQRDGRLAVGYFAQHQIEQLGMDETPLMSLTRINRGARESEIRGFLGQFGFSGDMVNEPVAIRSGGEKARLVLAHLVYQQPNLLLLDEPTNHLDMDMRQAIAAALQAFDGSLVIVAHDRYLLRLVTDELWLVDNGKVGFFSGDLDDYVRWLNERRRERSQAEQPAGSTKTESMKSIRKRKAMARAQTQPLRNKLKALETQLADVEISQRQIDMALSEPELYGGDNQERLKALRAQQSDNRARQASLEEDWLTAAAELEAVTESR